MIYPVILCGGGGTRLWPTSRAALPKQFVRLYGEYTLFQQAALRLSGDSFHDPIIMASSSYRFTVAEQMQSVNLKPNSIILEPVGRNTAPAILVAALSVAKHEQNGVLLVVPSDHVIPDANSFRAAVHDALATAMRGRIVTFGIRPTRPETGYGYLEVGRHGDGICNELHSFIEKPDDVTARKIISSGHHLWNAGIFMFRADIMLAAFEKYAPEMIDQAQAALTAAQPDLDFVRLDAGIWETLPSISIDYAIMEKANNLSVMPCNYEWSDLGSWSAVADQFVEQADERGNVVSVNAYSVDCNDCLLRSDDDTMKLVGIGLQDIVAIATKDAVLVTTKKQSQKVREAVDILKKENAKQATEFNKDYRPWGWFESLAAGARFQVKRIIVNPGGILSLQSHRHRAEHWIVVEGTARVTIGDTVKLVSENESVYVPLGALHRLENPGLQPLILIEVQAGSYLGEDDITRYEDIYHRN